MPAMHRLAEKLHQSCHLAVLSGNEIVVVARVESPHLLGFAVRVGYRVPVLPSPSGRVLLAYQTPERQQAWVETMLDEGSEPKAIQSFLEDIRQTAASGYHRAPSVFVDAITDLGVPMFDGVSQGPAASLMVPYVSGSSAHSTVDEALHDLLAAASEIGDGMRHG